MNRTTRAALAVIVAATLATTGCKKSEQELAPEASALAPAAPAAAQATTYVIDAPSSQVTFQMAAELEKISGRAPGSAEGELFIDPKNVSKTTGLVKVDLSKLSIYQKKRESADKEFGEEIKNEKQNEHMQTWFQISPDAPADVREKNRFAELKIKNIAHASANDVTTLSGAERKVTAHVVADLLLHGRVSEQKLAVEVTFKFEGDKATGIAIKTTEPFGVNLEAHDVRPRKAFDQLADATLETLGQKVNKVAQVSIEASAKPK